MVSELSPPYISAKSQPRVRRVCADTGRGFRAEAERRKTSSSFYYKMNARDRNRKNLFYLFLTIVK